MKPKEFPEVAQIGIVVKNIEEAVSYYSKMFNIGPFVRLDYTPEKAVLGGENVSFTLKSAFADWGKQNLEIIEVAEGEVQHTEFLRRTGGGIHHLGFYVDNLEEWIDYFDKQGVPVLMDMEGVVGPRGRRRAVFFDTSKGGVLFEFIQIL